VPISFRILTAEALAVKSILAVMIAECQIEPVHRRDPGYERLMTQIGADRRSERAEQPAANCLAPKDCAFASWGLDVFRPGLIRDLPTSDPVNDWIRDWPRRR
jgi:hypothetical protein